MKNSSDVQTLLAAARADGPSAAARDGVWSGIEQSLGLVPPPAPSGVRAIESAARPSSPPPTPVTAADHVLRTATLVKAGIVGGGIGGGLTAAAVFIGLHAATPSAAPETHERATIERSEGAGRLRPPSTLVPIATPIAESSPTASAREERAAPAEGDALTREVALVMGAREALLAGKPLRALDLAARARALHGQLDNEALTLEVRALRALGRDAEADRAEMELRVLHPR